MRCTDVSANWCAIHGDCACPRNADGETVSDDDPDLLAKTSDRCPLHAPWSEHGEEAAIATLWGDF